MFVFGEYMGYRNVFNLVVYSGYGYLFGVYMCYDFFNFFKLWMVFWFLIFIGFVLYFFVYDVIFFCISGVNVMFLLMYKRFGYL